MPRFLYSDTEVLIYIFRSFIPYVGSKSYLMFTWISTLMQYFCLSEKYLKLLQVHIYFYYYLCIFLNCTSVQDSLFSSINTSEISMQYPLSFTFLSE